MLLKENVITVNLPRSLIFPLPFTCALAFVENLFSLWMKARAVSGEYLNYFTINGVWDETVVIFDLLFADDTLIFCDAIIQTLLNFAI